LIEKKSREKVKPMNEEEYTQISQQERPSSFSKRSSSYSPAKQKKAAFNKKIKNNTPCFMYNCRDDTNQKVSNEIKRKKRAYKGEDLESYTLLQRIKITKTLLNSDEQKSLPEVLKFRVHERNFDLCYQLSKIFVPQFQELVLKYIDCSFVQISQSQKFLQINIGLLKRILKRNSLLVTSEEDVYEAASRWLSHRFDERENYARELLLTVRLSLFTDMKFLEILHSQNSPFSRNQDCREVMSQIANKIYDPNSPRETFTLRGLVENLYEGGREEPFTPRYCHHNVDHNVLLFYRNNTQGMTMRARSADGYGILKEVCLPTLRHYGAEAICLNREAYVFDRHFGNIRSTFDDYQPIKKIELATGDTEVIGNVADRIDYWSSYAVCSFKQKFYLIGGNHPMEDIHNRCLEFDPQEGGWKEKMRMISERESPAACPFKERIVVSGGRFYNNNDVHVPANRRDRRAINTVEAFCPEENAWEDCAPMIDPRYQHKQVAVRTKLYFIGGGINSMEVFDSASENAETLIVNVNLLLEPAGAFAAGEEIIVFSGPKVLYFNLITGNWRVEDFNAARGFGSYLCIKSPAI